MTTSALALAGVIAIRSDDDAEAVARFEAKKIAPAPPLLDLYDRRPSRYQTLPWPIRQIALWVTAAVHVLVAAVVIYDWHRPEKAARPDQTIVVTLLPLAQDRPAQRPKHGVVAEKTQPQLALAELPPPIVKLPQQPPFVVDEPAIEPSVPAGSGKVDQLVATTQAYQRAVIARIEAVRIYPRAALLQGYQGTGAIVFHIDRDGRLLAVSVNTSTGRKALDRAALALVQRAAPFLAIPAELPDELAITMPIRFLIVEPSLTMAAR